jgi:hypothetical protein
VISSEGHQPIIVPDDEEAAGLVPQRRQADRRHGADLADDLDPKASVLLNQKTA